ncbi:MAG: M28 family peptidase [Gemmatimonadaceae bacterium]|nr:M28 family peptidase [Gemmatimonadaceae bacterium]
MRRRRFIGALGSSLAASAALGPLPLLAAALDSRHLVATPEARARYLARMLDMLCTGFGPRYAGSEDYDLSAELIRRELALAVPHTELDWFEFLGWRLLEEPVFYCDGRSLECYPAFGSAWPPEQGARGILRAREEEGGAPFAIVDPSSGAAAAHVTVSAYGRAVTGAISPGHEGATVPRVCVGKQDVSFLQQAAAEGARARLHFKAEFVPGARTCNIVGTLPGETEEEILVFAHADTQYNTQGANDNTASLIVVLMLAHAVSGTRPRRTLTFMGTGAEEYNLLGALHYAARREAEGTLDRIRFCVNFDSLTYGPNLYVHTDDPELVRVMDAIHDDLRPHNRFDPAYPIAFENQPFIRGEARIFSDAGARTIDLNSRGYDEDQLPLWHRPEDTAETVPLDCVENSFLVFDEYLRRLQAL